jgi:hypothetical protein
MSEEKLGLFDGEDRPTVESAWKFYQKGLQFNNQINLDETVKSNRNFAIGKQWEGVNANGLPQPVFNILKRVTGFIIASITTDNLKVNVTPLANTPNTDDLVEPARIVNEECDALMEINKIPALIRDFARAAAVDGDGCIYTYWDPDVNCGGGVMGAVKSELIDNTRVFFGNPNDKNVQTQPYIQIANREFVRTVKIRARDNGASGWDSIESDTEAGQAVDSAKRVDDKVTVLLTLWKDEQTGEIWAFESTESCAVREPWSLGIQLYPIVWLCWDAISNCYHGQAMITGLIPNQIFINKAWAMSMLSIMRTAWPKVVFDKTRISKWDNRVGGAIGINGGDVNSVAKIIDPASIDPQIAQFINMAVQMTEESLGATASALGEGKAYNTSAILSLQRAAATPTEVTKQNLYVAVEDQFRIYKEFMGGYYGTRYVDIETPPEVMQAQQFANIKTEDTIPVAFDFGQLKELPMNLSMDVGGSSYFSEMASMQTLDNMVSSGLITLRQYLERIPDTYFPKRRALISELMQQEMGMMQPPMPPDAGGGSALEGPMNAALAQEPEITGGRGYRAAARAVNAV